ncbi:MAG: GntR family transcriptional regulator [Lachnospiraceae bacterium]|nr:GntR family transcriptional regulator [Lachnospiraceae bacterium]MDE6252420.1 GntR family transcriptional regulator [Lachnospiraceae bacterium]
MLNIKIKNNVDKPIYEQIIIQIKNSIISGELQQKEMLPSIRTLAKELQISVITTKRAYEELEKEGLIYGIAGKGFFVSDKNIDILREKKIQMLEEKLMDIVSECTDAGLSIEDIHSIIDVMSEEKNQRAYKECDE